MSPESLLEQFGYFAVFVGTFLEGEAILVAAGFFASRGYLDVVAVYVVAFAGAFLGHVFWFWLGRAHGVKLLRPVAAGSTLTYDDVESPADSPALALRRETEAMAG